MKEMQSKNLSVEKRVESLERLLINIETALRLYILSCFLEATQPTPNSRALLFKGLYV